MSSNDEQQQAQDRRRPFSVNDINRRTREVKIFNTTTITTTTHSHDASRVVTSTSTNNENSENNYAENTTTTTINGQPVYSGNSDSTRTYNVIR